MSACDYCGEAPAAVFRPDHALCKPCHRAIDRFEQEDNMIPNFEACAECGGVTKRNGFCADCDAAAARRFAERLVRAS